MHSDMTEILTKAGFNAATQLARKRRSGTVSCDSGRARFEGTIIRWIRMGIGCGGATPRTRVRVAEESAYRVQSHLRKAIHGRECVSKDRGGERKVDFFHGPITSLVEL